MNLDTYQQGCLTTWSNEPDASRRILNACLGLAGEVGEVLEPIKKAEFHGRILDRDKLKLELGDVLYYLSVLAHELGLNLNAVAAANLDKLQKRYNK